MTKGIYIFNFLGIFTKDVFDAVSVDHIVPVVVYLCHESCKNNASLFEVGGGWFAKMRWEKTGGAAFDFPVTVEDVKTRFSEILDYSNPEYPETTAEVAAIMFQNYERNMERLSANPTSDKSLPSDEVFQLMGNYIKTGESASAVKVCGAIYNFEIVENLKGPVIKTWGIDLKNGNGSV